MTRGDRIISIITGLAILVFVIIPGVASVIHDLGK